MKFSVATPVYNGMPSLPGTLGSLRGQAGHEVEHIIHDGGSNDGSLEYLSSQNGIDLSSGADRGMYDAINRCWSRATGNVFSWLNADEQYLPGTLNKVASIFDAHPDVDVVWGNTIMVTPEGEPLAARREIPLRLGYVKNGFLYALSCTMFFRSSLWSEGLLKIDDSFRNAGDGDLVLRLLTNRKRFYHIQDYLSLFGVGANLTVELSDNMAKEMERLRRDYGALPSPLLRRLVVFGRYAERLIKGCYLPANIEYDFAMNDTPDYRRIRGQGLTGRFTYESAMEKMRAS